jgi:hypothetical protein
VRKTIVVLGAIAALAVVWGLGFLYWRIRLERSIDTFKLHWFEAWARHDPDEALPRSLGSRAIPRLLREMELERNLPKPDYHLLIAWGAEVERAIEESERDWTVPPLFERLYPPRRILEATSMERHLSRWWTREEENFPPAWQWWSGRRRKPPDSDSYPENRSAVNP